MGRTKIVPTHRRMPSAARPKPVSPAGVSRHVVGRRSRSGLERVVVQHRVALGGHLALERQRPADRVVGLAGDHQVLSREAGDHLAAVGGDHQLLLDPRCRPAVAGRPEGLEREHHARLDLLGMVERDQPTEDRLLPDREPDAVAELKRERGLLVGEAELLRLGPDADHLAGGGAGLDQGDGRVEVIAATLVGLDERLGGPRHRERAVVARAVAHVAVQDVEVRRVARAQRPVGVDVGMGVAALARDRVDPLDELRPHVVEDLIDQADALVLAHPGPHGAVELLVGGVDHRARLVQEQDLVCCLDHAGSLHELLAVDDLDAAFLKGEQDRQLDRIDAHRLAEQAALLELDVDLGGHVLRPAGLGGHRASQGRDAGARAAVAQPRVVKLVVARRRAEVPHDRLVVLGQQAEAVQLVLSPGADVRRRDVSDVRHVEAQQRAERGVGEQPADPRQPLLAQPVEADPLLPVDGHRPVRVQSHSRAPLRCARS